MRGTLKTLERRSIDKEDEKDKNKKNLTSFRDYLERYRCKFEGNFGSKKEL